MFCFGGLVFAQSEYPTIQRPTIVSPRISALGAPYTTLQAGSDTLSTNPALFSQFQESSWAIARLAVEQTEDALSSVSLIGSNNKRNDFVEHLFAKDKCNYKLNVTGPLAFAKTGKNFAFGIFNRSLISAKSNSTKVQELLIGEEILMTGGYGNIVYSDDLNSIAIGVQAKSYFQTFSYALDMPKIDLATSAGNDFKDLKLMFAGAVGIDFGFLYNRSNYLSLALTCQDAYTALFLKQYDDFDKYSSLKPNKNTKYQYIYPNLSIGVSTTPITEGTWETVSSWAFYLDYRDIVQAALAFKNTKRNPALNIAFGTELIFHDVLSFRAGMYELYPHFGFGLDFTYFNIDFSGYLQSDSNKIWKDYYMGMDFALSFTY